MKTENNKSSIVMTDSATGLGKGYNITNNKNGRRILIVNTLLDVDRCNEISKDDFDAIFVNIADTAHLLGKKFDAVILAVAHDAFRSLRVEDMTVGNGVIYDVKGKLDRDIITARL